MAKIITLTLAVIIFQDAGISLMIFIVSQPQDYNIHQKASNKKVKCSLGTLYGLPETRGADGMTCRCLQLCAPWLYSMDTLASFSNTTKFPFFLHEVTIEPEFPWTAVVSNMLSHCDLKTWLSYISHF